jgi:hypothetical protein
MELVILVTNIIQNEITKTTESSTDICNINYY